MRRSTRALALPASVLASALTLSGCSLFAPDFSFVVSEGVPAEYTEPGAQLAVGDVARVRNESPKVDLAISIRTVEEFDNSLFEQFQNAEDFDQFTPVAVVIQYEALASMEKFGNLPTFESLGGMLSNGESAEALTSGYLAVTESVCPFELADGGEGQWELSCIVYLVPKGEELATIGFYGYDYYAPIASFIEPGNEAFETSPILWTL